MTIVGGAVGDVLEVALDLSQPFLFDLGTISESEGEIEMRRNKFGGGECAVFETA